MKVVAKRGLQFVTTFILLTAGIAIADNPTRYQWSPGLVFNGGINTTSDKGQLEANQLLDANNFIWRDNQLQVREGFYRYVAPLTNQPVKFMDIFRNTGGEAYLLYSDGAQLWYRSGLTSPSVELNFGRSNRGIVDTWATVVGGDSIAVQKWRCIFGSGEGLTMTIDGTDYTVNKILLDTLLYLTETAGTTTDKAYNIDYSTITIQDGLVMSDNYWLYANVGKFYFNRPDSFVIVDSLEGLRYSYSSVSRRISPTHSLLFSATGVTKNYAGQFLRITTNPFSAGGAKNPVTAGHPYYMSYPVRTSGSSQVSTYASPFQPDSLPDQYFTIEELVYDSTTRIEVVCDSIELIAADSSGFAATNGTTALYLKVHGGFDSSDYITGDWFVSPSTVNTFLGEAFSIGTPSTLHNTIVGTKFTTPNEAAIKAYHISWNATSGGITTADATYKGAIYRVSDGTLVDTTKTLLVPTGSFVGGQTLEFAEGSELAASTEYYAAIWSDSNVVGTLYKTGTGSFTLVKDYDGTFPTTLTGATIQSTRSYSASIEIDYYSSSAGLYTSASYCFPVVGGYATAGGAIYVSAPSGKRNTMESIMNRMRDTDTCKLMFYRMKKNTSGSRSAGLRFASLFQDRVFTAKDTMCNQLEWSEPFMPDSSFATSVMIINSGDGQCITAVAAQYADLIVYMPDSRWKIFGDGTNAGYGKERMNGSVGCVAKGSLLNIDNNHFFLHSTGYYTSNGDAPVLVSGAVNKYFTDSINTAEYAKVASGYDLERGNIWISFPRIGATSNTITLVYNIATQSWWREGVNAAAYYYNPDLQVSDSVRFLIGKTDSSTILVRGRDKDDGANIDAYIRTGYLDFEQPDNYKRLEKFHLRHNVVSTCDSIVQATYVDTVTATLPSVSYVPAATWSDRRVTMRDDLQMGERFSLKWTLYDSGKTMLPHLSVRFWLGSEGE